MKTESDLIQVLNKEKFTRTELKRYLLTSKEKYYYYQGRTLKQIKDGAQLWNRWSQGKNNGTEIRTNSTESETKINSVRDSRNENEIDPRINILDEFGMEFDFEEGESEKVDPYVFPIRERLLGLFGDSHLKYQEIAPIKKALRVFKDRGVDTIILNGDFLDLPQISKYDTAPSRTTLKDELEIGKQFLYQLRQIFPSEKIVLKLGNHDYRLEKYIITRAPQLFGLDAINLKELLGLKEYNIDFVEQDQSMIYGNYLITHGHEWGVGGGINPARSVLLKAWTNVIVNHFHVTGQANARNGRDELITAYTVGCMCGLYPKYRPHNNWNHGYLLAQMDSSGKCEIENKMI